MNDEEQKNLLEKINRLEGEKERAVGYRNLWFLILLFLVICEVNRIFTPKEDFSPWPDHPFVTATKHFFSKEENAYCEWRKDDLSGELAWCAKDTNGNWRAFIDPNSGELNESLYEKQNH